MKRNTPPHILLYSISLVLFIIVVSCSSTSSNQYKGWNEYTGNEKQNFILKARSIQEEASTYALQRSLNISVKSSDIISENEPIYIERDNIPQMANRIEKITKDIEDILKKSSNEIQGIYLHLVYREQLNADSFKKYISGDSIVEYILNKYEKDIKTSLATLLDGKFKEADLYTRWNGIFETYKLWKLSIDNIANISNLGALNEQNDLSLIKTTTELIFNKWETELKIGEEIAKIQVAL